VYGSHVGLRDTHIFLKIIGQDLDCFIGLVVSNVHSYYLLMVSCFWWTVSLMGDLLMASSWCCSGIADTVL
jgi:hypothetical protein